MPKNPGIRHQDLWQQAVRTEIQRARARIRYFAERLAQLQQGRLKQFPLPQIDQRKDLHRTARYRVQKREFQLHTYLGPKDTTVVKISTPQGKPFLYKVLDGRNHGNNLLYGHGRGYERIDLLGDGSFILARPIDKGVYIPHWVWYKKPIVGFGV